MRIEVVYALPEIQWLMVLEPSHALTVEQAIIASGILEQCPDINLAMNPVGIFGKQVERSTELRDGDRVEIYRPLQMDPKEMRRNRFAIQTEPRRAQRT